VASRVGGGDTSSRKLQVLPQTRYGGGAKWKTEKKTIKKIEKGGLKPNMYPVVPSREAMTNGPCNSEKIGAEKGKLEATYGREERRGGGKKGQKNAATQGRILSNRKNKALGEKG